MTIPVETTMIDITPTDEGYFGIAAMFAEQIISDVKVGRKGSDMLLMGQLVRIVGYLGASGRTDLVKRLLERYDDSETASPR